MTFGSTDLLSDSKYIFTRYYSFIHIAKNKHGILGKTSFAKTNKETHISNF